MVEKYWAFSLGFGLSTFAFNNLTLWQDLEGDRSAGLYTAPMQLGKYTFHVTVITVLVSMFFYVLSDLPPMSRVSFIGMNLLVLVGSPSVLLNNKSLVEYNCRIFGRLMLIISFLLMLIRI